MFPGMNRILRWTQRGTTDGCISEASVRFATWAAAGPVMLAAWALGLVIGVPRRTALDAEKAPLAIAGRDHPADRSALRVAFTWKNRLREYRNRARRRRLA